ncbi:FERM domain-containing protein 5 isoform X2 [Folsomia candida]|uniref:FERM domain-containing protein 5 isoform X2 n=1 Tax=Folsomia candida TaxID=158441 RepID=UPI000B8F5963|nr:FERM domain-containing protein 5 isoform X2 [Folsomia candida]
MTKELQLEEDLQAASSASAAKNIDSALYHKSSEALNVGGSQSHVPASLPITAETPESCQSSQSFISSPPASKMIRRSSKSDLRGGYKCTIRLLDDNEILQCDFLTHHKGQYLMDYVCRQLNIAEKDYFGLRYVDSNKQRHWLDLGKSIIKQMKDNAYILCFRFKFYPQDPMLLKEEVTRYQLVLQLRRDVLHGRLFSTLSDMATIVSFILQSELGDYDLSVHTGNYAAEYELISRQTQDLEEKAMELHQKLRGLTPTEADTLFLKKAASLDTYGLDPCPVKDQQGEQLYLGINYTGIRSQEMNNYRKVTHFKWTQITKLNYEAKMFIIHLSIPEDSRIKKKETVGFKCLTSSACKFLWRSAVEQRLFFNCGSATDVPNSVRGGGIFGSRVRYHGRVQREILEDPGPLRASDAVIQRTPLYRSLQRNKTRSLPHSPTHPGYDSLPRSNHSAPPMDGARLDATMMGTLGSSTSLPLSTLSSPYYPEHTLPMLETLRESEDSPRVEEKAFAYNEGGGDAIATEALRETKIDNLSSLGKPKHGFAAMWKIFIVCFICVIVALLLVAIMVIELDVDLCRRMRHIPEVEYFQYEVYQPFKSYMKAKLHGIEHFN